MKKLLSAMDLMYDQSERGCLEKGRVWISSRVHLSSIHLKPDDGYATVENGGQRVDIRRICLR